MNNHLFSFGAALLLTFAPISAAVAAPVPTGEVVIVSTGDRLTPGYQVTVQPSGIIASTLIPRRRHAPIHRTDKMIAATRQRFFADLQKAEPLDRLPTGTIALNGSRQVQGGSGSRRFRQRQATPAGSGRRLDATGRPQIYVVYGGRQSPNLRAVNSDSGRTLYQDVKQILSVLRMPIPNVP